MHVIKGIMCFALKDSTECMKGLVEFKSNAEEQISFLRAAKDEHFKTIVELKTEATKHTRRVKALELGLFKKDKQIKRLKDQLTTQLGMVADDVDNFEQVKIFISKIKRNLRVLFISYIYRQMIKVQSQQK